MRHLKEYHSKSEYEADYHSGKLPFPHVCAVNGKAVYAKSYQAEKKNDIPMYIEALEDTSVSFTTNQIQYSLDNETWVDLPANTNAPAISAGGKMYFRAEGLSPTSSAGIGTFKINGKCNVGGNIMSLLYGDDFADAVYIEKIYSFYRLFYQQTAIVDAGSLVLPATTLANYCYQYMFQNCSSLVNAPELPAMSLASACYSNMFNGCTSLVNAPELPAMSLASSCYAYMFNGCTSLINAPKLPALAMESYCYSYMFSYCTSLVNAPALPATTMQAECYRNMFQYCSNLVNAPELPALTLSSNCYSYMFQYCTSLVNAPELPATTLTGSCYQYMFNGCTSLVNAPKILPATTLANYCYQYMFQNCSSLVNAPELPAMSLASSCYNYMFQYCSSLQYIKAMFTTTPSSPYLSSWVNGVKSVGTFVKNAAATWTDTFGLSAIPTGWTVELAEA